MRDFLEIGGLIALSSVKYVVVALGLLASSSRFWIFDFLILGLGGSLGVICFTFFGSFVSKYLERFAFLKVKFKNLRRLVHIKKIYGIIGLAFLTPLVVGIPLGSILSNFFETEKKIIIKIQIASVWMWSFILFGTKGLIQYLA